MLSYFYDYLTQFASFYGIYFNVAGTIDIVPVTYVFKH
uniref:Uncharacterized protein n=1 Tax=Sphingobacterium sp. (strain 21) TaxID=743722 RepID=F4C761_SPHS2